MEGSLRERYNWLLSEIEEEVKNLIKTKGVESDQFPFKCLKIEISSFKEIGLRDDDTLIYVCEDDHLWNVEVEGVEHLLRILDQYETV